jgi:hypothetical protein
MAHYQPPSEDLFDVMMFGDGDAAAGEPTPEQVELREIHAQWVDLHTVTKKNLEEFEKLSFRLRSKATGHKEVKNLVRFRISTRSHSFYQFILIITSE